MRDDRPVIGLLYAGDMGTALGALLAARGFRVVTTLAGRSHATAARCRVNCFDVLPQLVDVVRVANVVLSVVPPDVAEAVAHAYAGHATVAPIGAIFVDINSVQPVTIQRIDSVIRHTGCDCVDASINGLAQRANTAGTMFLSGPRADAIASIFSGAIRTEVLGDTIGQASAMKMLLAGAAKGVCGLMIELLQAANSAALSVQFGQAMERIYPDIWNLTARVLPTYTTHASRRAKEMEELEQFVTTLGGGADVISAVRALHHRLAEKSWASNAANDAASFIQHLRKATPSDLAAKTPHAEAPRLEERAMTNKPRSAHLHPGPGFRVRINIERPPAKLIRGFLNFPTPDISDLLNRLYAVDPQIRLLTAPTHRVCGPVCTVNTFPGDNLMVHKSLDILEPGDVVVIDAGGSNSNAVLGDLIATKARHRGCAGFVVDGLVRDLPTITEVGMPVFARGTTPIGPLHRGPGEINYPICCGGVVVNPGDIIVGDAMGVVVVPQGIAAELLERLTAHAEANEDYFYAVKRGVFSNAWVDELLIKLECPMVRGDSASNSAIAAETPRVASDSVATGNHGHA